MTENIEDIETYVQQERKQGTPDEEIRSSLIEAGKDPEEVDQHLQQDQESTAEKTKEGYEATKDKVREASREMQEINRTTSTISRLINWVKNIFS